MVDKKLKVVVMLVIMAIFGTLISGCGNKNTATQGQQEKAEKKVVEFNYPELVYYDYIYLADELGYFKDAGVRPKYVGKIATGQVIPSLVSGSIDVATRHTPVVIAAIASGADVKIFAAGSKSTKQWPHMKYFVRADSDIKSVKDFGGKTIGLNSFGACSEYVTKKYLKDNGVDPTTLSFKTAPEDQQEIPLSKGNTDIAIIHPPTSGRTAESPNFKMLFSDWDIDGGISGMCPYSVSGKFLKEHPEAVKELTEILIKTSKWNNEHPEEARAIMAKRFNIKPSQAEMYEFYEDQLVPEKGVQYWIDRLVEENKLSAGQVKLEQIYTNEYNPNYKK
ncbi:ABC transporter substrate-binding protein [Sporomusa sp.]|uniref:ABC transporter substrate-binding protein n=1 Tax=Sporomusa sp. TaxID=2078658 RepID=UPI002C6FB5BC|nr:ABC transporter substrate-binding protein [Sporomusa sp.]HWR44855.1 ABC transporter substrate-binding protein [Sporomusa sp.]